MHQNASLFNYFWDGGYQLAVKEALCDKRLSCDRKWVHIHKKQPTLWATLCADVTGEANHLDTFNLFVLWETFTSHVNSTANQQHTHLNTLTICNEYKCTQLDVIRLYSDRHERWRLRQNSGRFYASTVTWPRHPMSFSHLQNAR